ncbi:MAG: hypothetical protein EA411_09720 [Saprospirales bacterium]|nr:MAG: hypothetical protein EA411_09720 [Saprospirales bacterium]
MSMSGISIRMEGIFWEAPEFIERWVSQKRDEEPFPSLMRNDDKGPDETTAVVDLVPLSEVSINSKQFRIISVTERTTPFDRLLAPPGQEKNLPKLAQSMNIFTLEDRSVKQWKQVASTEADVIQTKAELKAAMDDEKRGFLVPWWFNSKAFTSRGWIETELHAAEFTPRAGAGCWAFIDRGQTPDSALPVLRELHHPATVVLTNAERRLLRDFEKEDQEIIGILIDRPTEDKYHLYICIEDKAERKIKYLDYPCTAIGNLNEEVFRLIDEYFEPEKKQ